jgi:hypothetical protein
MSTEKKTDKALKWIEWLPRAGWPVVAVIVMVMCAPGEHALAVLAGWEEHLAWGMPACLVAYAGIAASVATRRSKGAQGRATAIVGAFTSLAAAMAAQPVSHLFVTGHWDASPSPVWLVVAVSCVPPLVLGHLMHVAASHGRSAETPAETVTAVAETSSDASIESLRAPLAVPKKRLTKTPARPALPTPETPDETKTLLTVAEAAAVASQVRGETVSSSTVRTWKHRGRLTPALDEDGTLFERDAVVAAATRNGKNPAPATDDHHTTQEK